MFWCELDAAICLAMVGVRLSSGVIGLRKKDLEGTLMFTGCADESFKGSSSLDFLYFECFISGL